LCRIAASASWNAKTLMGLVALMGLEALQGAVARRVPGPRAAG